MNNKFPHLRRAAFVGAIIFLIVVFDQITKYWARSSLGGGQTYHFLSDIFRIQLSFNTGAFLSLGAGANETVRFWVFTVGVGVFLAGCLVYLIVGKNIDRLGRGALTIVVAGGVGNLIDRALFGAVTDFLNVGLGWLRTGIFNIADMAISTGVLIMLMQSFGLFTKQDRADKNSL